MWSLTAENKPNDKTQYPSDVFVLCYYILANQCSAPITYHSILSYMIPALSSTDQFAALSPRAAVGP